ncbi:hypothetical protein BGW36DRAFT_377778 [Talaromyces proteolyticus]|uniref:Pentatricopeptide repeat protein n=1 Tax=Talaromyces proteolyticus TaxID=1131652 RepID=A0AAD4KQD6_9EURO|nr:uncharacterized protein BGW36DRAFT_377778 [Talaromyces proteolyticus]KAH8697016.1 hypothetical protein BGW36DRAFT_377778 [Talaromyces proteolyticus]
MPKYTNPVACCKLTAQLSLSGIRSRASAQGWNLKKRAGENAANTLHATRVTSRFSRGANVRDNFGPQSRCLHDVGRRLIHSGSLPESDPDPGFFHQDSTKAPGKRRVVLTHFTPIYEEKEWGQRGKKHLGRRPKAQKSKLEKSRQYVLSNFKPIQSSSEKEYVSSTSVPKRVKAAIKRAQSSLKAQGRVLSREAFDFDINIRVSSMFPYTGTPEWWTTSCRELFMAKTDKHEHTWKMPEKTERFTFGLIDTIKGENIQSFKTAWESLNNTTKQAQWPLIALWLLREMPCKLPDFLMATNSKPYPLFSMVSDCMSYIRTFHSKDVDPDSFRAAILTCMGPDRWPVAVLPQRGVRRYARAAGVEKAQEAFEILRSREYQLSAATLLCFMNIFTQAENVDKALECLRMVHAMDSQSKILGTEDVIRHCCKLLQLDSVVEEDGVRNFKILPQLLELGVNPTLEMMNVVLANAFATGDPYLGLDMLNYMKDRGMELDSYTYCTLLSDAVARSDRSRIESLMQEIYPREELRNEPHVASKILHAHFIFGAENIDMKSDSSRVFMDMLELYCRCYDPTPLKDLQIIPPHFNNVDIECDTQPSSHALFLILATYLRCNTDPIRVMRLYRKFRELASQQHPVISPLVQYPHLFNEFILSFRHHSSDLRHCVSIVEDMLRPVPESITVAGPRITPAKPNVWTWNTLLSVLNIKKQPNGIKVIQGMMERHGVKPDMVTWNTIIYGTATRQDMISTAFAIRKMESEGFTPDSDTLRALRYARDPEKLHAAFDKLNDEDRELSRRENEVLEQENEELLDKGLQRLAIAGKTANT